MECGLRTDLGLSLVEHVKCGLLQVLLLRLGGVIDVDAVRRAVRQVAVVDGASCCFQLGTQQLVSELMRHLFHQNRHTTLSDTLNLYRFGFHLSV